MTYCELLMKLAAGLKLTGTTTMKDALAKHAARFNAKRLMILVLLVLLTGSCWLMAKTVFIYVPFNESVGFLIVKRSWLVHDWWRVAFQVHVYSSGVAMLAGFSQFWGRFKSARYRRWHRRLGYGYVATILALSLPSGLVLALTALGGWPVRLSFTLLCLLWGLTTIGGVYFAINRQPKKHRTLMVYSYALTLSAVTLRFLKLLLYQLAPFFEWLTPIHIYQTESVLAWGINLAVAWVYLNWGQFKSSILRV